MSEAVSVSTMKDAWPGPQAPFHALAVPRLADVAVLRLSGADARAFLSRQLTCDLSALAPDRALTGAWLTPKGRALVLMQLVEAPDGAVLAVLPASLADEVCRRLRLFVMRDDVAVACSGDLVAAGLAGAAVSAAEAACAPEALRLARLTVEGPLALLIGEPAAVDDAIGELAGVARGDDDAWHRHLIAAGLPEVTLETREMFVPQMINLDRIGAVSFTKGCYPGQEIVARTQHLGRIKRRMFRALVDGETVPAPGTGVHGAEGDALGRVVSAAPSGDGAVHLLVVVTLDAASSGAALHLGSAGGSRLRLVAPPYPLEG
jgi:folate-binding protein YgfZ